MITKALKELSAKIVSPNVVWANEYRPRKHFNDADREDFFTNFNHELVRRIRNERLSKR